MQKTSDEIKKGLEVCNIWMVDEPNRCKECTYFCTKDCADTLMKHALALIQQLQADNAQQARCIENMTDKLNAMNDEVAKLQAERDAAVSELVGTCEVCRWEETAKCASCHFCEYAWNAHESNWEWRGVQKEATP